MSSDAIFVIFGLGAVTLALLYYTRVELPLREDERMRQALQAFAKAVELRFPSHAGSSARVAALSRYVGEELKLDPWTLHELEMGAWLRDIGLCAIPYGLVNRKPAYSWTEADHATYARHPDVSAAMLELVPAVRRLAPIVRSHHANFDGSSGPYFPHGTALPIEARILKVISDYVWFERRQGQLLAREALRDGAGSAYDPDVVAAFVGVIASKRVAEPTEQMVASMQS